MISFFPFYHIDTVLNIACYINDTMIVSQCCNAQCSVGLNSQHSFLNLKQQLPQSLKSFLWNIVSPSSLSTRSNSSSTHHAAQFYPNSVEVTWGLIYALTCDWSFASWDWTGEMWDQLVQRAQLCLMSVFSRWTKHTKWCGSVVWVFVKWLRIFNLVKAVDLCLCEFSSLE